MIACRGYYSAMCCSVLQCVTVRCTVLQCFAVQCGSVWFSVVQCVAAPFGDVAIPQLLISQLQPIAFGVSLISNQQTTDTHFGENKRLHFKSSKQSY